MFHLNLVMLCCTIMILSHPAMRKRQIKFVSVCRSSDQNKIFKLMEIIKKICRVMKIVRKHKTSRISM